MTKRLRKGAMRLTVAIALAGAMSSGPVSAVPLGDQSRIDDLAATVEALDVNAVPVVTVEEALPTQELYERIGAGEASYYGRELAGNRTASGERFNPQALTAAHRSLPMGTKLRVTNQSNGKSVIVRVNDRGPFVKSRIIDVSLAAAQKIQMVRSGKAHVTLEIVRIA